MMNLNNITFDRIFSMSTFEGLRLIRRELSNNPLLSEMSISIIIMTVESNTKSLDLEASFYLNDIVGLAAPFDGKGFYRECISAVIINLFPTWAKLITLGRLRFIQGLKGEEFRDVQSLFRQAGLLETPPEQVDIEWWDHVSALVRLEGDKKKLERGREAEKLTLEREREILQKQGIEKQPVWIAIEDNTAGYDVLSYTKGKFGVLNKLIEVKSTSVFPPIFYITRNEWNQALEVGESYFFHIWDMNVSPPILHERSSFEIISHIPIDCGKGKWQVAIIPVNKS